MTAPELPPEFTVTSEAQLTALMQFPFGAPLLGRFAIPQTANAVAQAMGLGAGRVAYHVNKHLRLGLLRTVGRRGQGRLLQLQAHRYRLAPELYPLLDAQMVRPMMTSLVEGFLAAPLPQREVTLLSLSPEEAQPPSPDELPDGRLGSTRILALSGARRRRLLADLIARIAQEEGHPDNAGRPLHTVALLEFAGSPFPVEER